MKNLISDDQEMAKIMEELRSIVIPSPDFYCDECENNNQKVLKLLDQLKQNLNRQRVSAYKRDK